ncbi:MAG: hypothetical protein ACR2KK_15015 [Acidimicrobiales bacterium]
MSAETPTDPLSSAAKHAELGLPKSAALPKRLVERLSRFFLDPQRAYNRGVIDAIRLLRDDDLRLGNRITLQSDDIARLTAALRTDLTRVELELADSRTDAALTRGQVIELAKMVQRLESRMAQLDAGRTED